jgi:cytochrome c biogenesis protein ResB
VKGIVRFLASVRLAVVLIAYLGAASALSTLVPQGGAEAEYLALYGAFLGRLVALLGIGRFFTSPVFLVPAGLFVVNLGACAFARFARELGKGGRKNFGPDILHLGLLVLILAAALSAFGRIEGSADLAEGEALGISGGYVLRVNRIGYLAYPDGRPRDYVTAVDLYRDEKKLFENYEIRVNHPLATGGFSVYQAGYAEKPANETAAVTPITALKVVSDPGYPFAAAALVMTGIGFALVFIRKGKRA